MAAPSKSPSRQPSLRELIRWFEADEPTLPLAVAEAGTLTNVELWHVVHAIGFSAVLTCLAVIVYLQFG